MESNQQKEYEYIETLLDIEQYSGEAPTRMGPIIGYLTVAFGPLLLFVLYLMPVIPFKIAAVFYLFYFIRVTMIMVGEESKRVAMYKQQMYDEYSSISEILNIVEFYKDGLIEYKNNQVSYVLVAHNKNDSNPKHKVNQVTKMLTSLDKDYRIDVRSQNLLDKDELISRYDGVSMFIDRETAKDYLEIIDFNRNIIKDDTLMTRIVITISARKRYFKKLKQDIDKVLNSQEVGAFKDIQVLNREEVKEVISRDIDTYIDFMEIQRKRHAIDNFYGSKVEAYDYVDETEIKEVTLNKKVKEERGFMR